MSENRTAGDSRCRRGENRALRSREIFPGGEMTEQSADPTIARRRRRREVSGFHFFCFFVCTKYELSSFPLKRFRTFYFFGVLSYFSFSTSKIAT